MIFWIFVAFLLGILVDNFIYSSIERGSDEKNNSAVSSELDRMAKLLLIGGSLKELIDFTKSKVGLLKEETFSKLCARIEELTADQFIYEDENLLKFRIASVSNKEAELKKMQAESFLETLNTIKAMCK